MKFRTRLMITALSMILLPLFLTILAFLVLGSHIEGTEFTNGFLNNNNSYTIENYSRMTEEVMEKVKEQITKDSFSRSRMSS